MTSLEALIETAKEFGRAEARHELAGRGTKPDRGAELEQARADLESAMAAYGTKTDSLPKGLKTA